MLPERLKKIIRDSGLPLGQFAQKTGVSKNTLINYRDGVTSPSAEFLEFVCREFSADPCWLLLGEQAPGPVRCGQIGDLGNQGLRPHSAP